MRKLLAYMFYMHCENVFVLLILLYQYLKCIHNLIFVLDGSTSPGSKMQIEMDITSSQSSLSFGTYNYQYTRGIDVQQVIIRKCYRFKTCSDIANSIYETGLCIPNKSFTMDCFIIKSACFLLRYTNWNTDNTHSVS